MRNTNYGNEMPVDVPMELPNSPWADPSDIVERAREADTARVQSVREGGWQTLEKAGLLQSGQLPEGYLSDTPGKVGPARFSKEYLDRMNRLPLTERLAVGAALAMLQNHRDAQNRLGAWRGSADR